MDIDKNIVQLSKFATSTAITAENIANGNFAESYNALADAIKYLEESKKELDSNIKAALKENYLNTGEQSIVTKCATFTYVPETTRETFDSKAVKANNPELYKQYVKVSSVSDSIRVSKPKDKLSMIDVGGTNV